MSRKTILTLLLLVLSNGSRGEFVCQTRSARAVLSCLLAVVCEITVCGDSPYPTMSVSCTYVRAQIQSTWVITA